MISREKITESKSQKGRRRSVQRLSYFFRFLDFAVPFFFPLLEALLFLLKLRARAGCGDGICAWNNPTTFPSGSAPITDQPKPGTSCFSTSTVPPASLNLAVCESMSSTPMKSLGLSVSLPTLGYIPPPRCSGPRPVVSIIQYSIPGIDCLSNFQSKRSL